MTVFRVVKSKTIMGRKMGTDVKNPLRRSGGDGYTQCIYCSKWYTKLGISKHWDHCKSNPRLQLLRG